MYSKLPWEYLLPTCLRADKRQVQLAPMPEMKKGAAKQSSFQRITFSDLSNPGLSLSPEDLSSSLVGSNLHVFTLAELREITHNFSSTNFLGEGGFGPVHKGFVGDKARPGLKAQPVAVKLLDLEGNQGHKEWLAEVVFLGQLRHANLVKLIGYCYEDEHRLLMYEYMPKGSLENHLLKRYSVCLPWLTRLKIAVGAAKGLAFLHGAEKPVIYRDFKASNILLDSDFTAKLSDFGLAKDGPEGEETHVSTRVMGTHGYAAPEYVMTGHLTAKSDVYSFGVVLLELLTGRRCMDKKRPTREQNLVDWARPSLNDIRRLNRIMDPKLDGQFSAKGALKAAQLAYQCLKQNPKYRPLMSTVVETLEPLLEVKSDIPMGHFIYTVAPAPPVAEEVRKPAAAEEEEGRKASPRGVGEDDGEMQQHHRHRRRQPGERPHPGRLPRSPNEKTVFNFTDSQLYKNSVGVNGARHRGRSA